MNLKKAIILFSMGLMILLDNVDVTAVSLSLPYIAKEFQLIPLTLGWINNGYIIAATGALIAAGKLGDKYGNSKILLSGVTIFMLASLLVAPAENGIQLIILRIIQGLGFALTYPMTFAIIRSLFPKEQHGTAMGWFSGLTGFSVASGPIIGGLILAHFSWKMLFLLNVPLCILILLTIMKFIPNKVHNANAIICFPTVIFFSSFLFSLLALFTNISQSTVIILSLTLLTLLFLTAFIYFDKKADTPLLTFKLANKKLFFLVTFERSVVQFFLMIAFFIFSISLQNILGFSIITTTLLFLSMTVPMGIISLIAGKLVDRFNPQVVTFTSLFIMLSVAISFLFLQPNSNLLFISVLLCLLGTSISLNFPGSSTWALKEITSEEIGFASGLYYTIIGIGGALGIVVAALIIELKTKFLLDKMPELLGMYTETFKKIASGTEPITQIQILFSKNSATYIPLIQTNFFNGFHLTILTTILLLLISIILLFGHQKIQIYKNYFRKKPCKE